MITRWESDEWYFLVTWFVNCDWKKMITASRNEFLLITYIRGFGFRPFLSWFGDLFDNVRLCSGVIGKRLVERLRYLFKIARSGLKLKTCPKVTPATTRRRGSTSSASARSRDISPSGNGGSTTLATSGQHGGGSGSSGNNTPWGRSHP
jgi:hypothetical protein